MNFQRLLNTQIGRFFISVLLGLGLASLFNKACNDKNCIVFNGPVISEFEGKIYRHGDKCYKYSLNPDRCDTTKRVIDISDPNSDKANKSLF